MNPEYEIRDFIRVYGYDSNLSKNIRMGGVIEIPVQYQGDQQLIIPVTILYSYPNGDYLGEVIWSLA